MGKKAMSLRREFLFVLCLSSVCVIVLLATRTGLGSRSEVQLATVNAVLQMLAGRVPETADESFAVFSRRFHQKSSGRIKVWQNLDIPRQWAFEATGAGMWSEITVVGIMDLETESMLGLQVVNQNETAGLGSRVADPVFCEQFANLSIFPRVEMTGARFKNNQFDAVSGATVTSKSLETIINKTISTIRQLDRKKN